MKYYLASVALAPFLGWLLLGFVASIVHTAAERETEMRRVKKRENEK